MDPDPGSQNVTDPTDPDSKHCFAFLFFSSLPFDFDLPFSILTLCFCRKEKKRVEKELLSTFKDESIIVLADWLKVNNNIVLENV